MPIKGKKGKTESDFSEKILTKAKSIIGKSFRVKSIKVPERTRGNNNQGEKAETIGDFLGFRNNS